MRCLAVAVLAFLSMSSMGAPASVRAEEPAAPRYFEMRTYICHDGRLEALHKRFREHTTRLFEKHGMTNVGYWVPAQGDEAANTLVYLLAYPNAEARAASWKAFMADPEWKSVREASEKDGPIVKQVISKYLTPTDYSSLK